MGSLVPSQRLESPSSPRPTGLSRLGLALVFLGCGSVADNDPSFWEPRGDPGRSLGGASSTGGSFSTGGGGTVSGGGPSTGGAVTGTGSATSAGGSVAVGGSGATAASGASAGSGSGAAPATGCNLSFDVTTVTAGGKYSPKNVEATWVATATGQFIKTLEVYGSTRRVHLINWNRVSGGNTVDAVTGATLPNHSAHHVTWNCTNASQQVVPDGQYQLVVEFTEDNSAYVFAQQPQLATIPFSKLGKALDFRPADQAHFKNMHVVLQ